MIFFFFFSSMVFSQDFCHPKNKQKTHTYTHFKILWCRPWLTLTLKSFATEMRRKLFPPPPAFFVVHFRTRVISHLTFSDVLFSLRATAFSVTSEKNSMTSLGNRVMLRYSKMCFRNGMKAVIWNKGKSKWVCTIFILESLKSLTNVLCYNVQTRMWMAWMRTSNFKLYFGQ